MQLFTSYDSLLLSCRYFLLGHLSEILIWKPVFFPDNEPDNHGQCKKLNQVDNM